VGECSTRKQAGVFGLVQSKGGWVTRRFLFSKVGKRQRERGRITREIKRKAFSKEKRYEGRKFSRTKNRKISGVE
jgi:hypothetical protein